MLAGVFDRLEAVQQLISLEAGRCINERISIKNTTRDVLKSRLGGSKTSDDVFRTKNGGFYNQLWENGCRIRTKNQKLQHELPRRPDYAMFRGRML